MQLYCKVPLFLDAEILFISIMKHYRIHDYTSDYLSNMTELLYIYIKIYIYLYILHICIYILQINRMQGYCVGTLTGYDGNKTIHMIVIIFLH